MSTDVSVSQPRSELSTDHPRVPSGLTTLAQPGRPLRVLEVGCRGVDLYAYRAVIHLELHSGGGRGVSGLDPRTGWVVAGPRAQDRRWLITFSLSATFPCLAGGMLVPALKAGSVPRSITGIKLGRNFFSCAQPETR